MAKVLQTLRTNWKKSIFFSGVSAYGAHYANRKYEEKQLMRQYSKIAFEYGQKTIPIAAQKSYHVTVILNPAAHSGAARTRFEKFCSPLLHLAGIKVSVIRTTHSGNAQEIMNVMDDTDAVLIAGIIIRIVVKYPNFRYYFVVKKNFTEKISKRKKI